jgi:hypothetical protein
MVLLLLSPQDWLVVGGVCSRSLVGWDKPSPQRRSFVRTFRHHSTLGLGVWL